MEVKELCVQYGVNGLHQSVDQSNGMGSENTLEQQQPFSEKGGNVTLDYSTDTKIRSSGSTFEEGTDKKLADYQKSIIALLENPLSSYSLLYEQQPSVLTSKTRVSKSRAPKFKLDFASRNKQETKATKKEMPNNILTDVRSLTGTGMLNGVPVRYISSSREGCSKDQKPIGIVPWGGPRGADWDDGIYDGVREINLIYGNSFIGTIQVTYEKNCAMIQAPKHGSHGGQIAGHKTAQIKLQYPEEYLTAVTGHYSVLKDLSTPSPVIRSLTFKTNKKTHGPFGLQEGTPFSFGMEGGKIVGFRGRSGWYLDAIGFNIVAA